MSILCLIIGLVFFLGITGAGYVLINNSTVQSLAGMFTWFKPAVHNWVFVGAMAVLGLIIALPWFLLGGSCKKNKGLKQQIAVLKAKLKKRSKKKAIEEAPIADAYDNDEPVEGDTKIFPAR